MKRLLIPPAILAIFGWLLVLGPGCAFGGVLFLEDFETDLSQWTSGQGVIVNDPLEADQALTFTGLNAGGDIWTVASFTSIPGQYILSFDYLGTCGSQGCGGFVGYDPGDVWLAGTGGWPSLVTLPDTGQWEHITVPFTGPAGISLKVEDWSGAGGVAGDVYFDNFVLTAVPEPATYALVGLGLCAFALLRRRSA